MAAGRNDAPEIGKNLKQNKGVIVTVYVENELREDSLSSSERSDRLLLPKSTAIRSNRHQSAGHTSRKQAHGGDRKAEILKYYNRRQFNGNPSKLAERSNAVNSSSVPAIQEAVPSLIPPETLGCRPAMSRGGQNICDNRQNCRNGPVAIPDKVLRVPSSSKLRIPWISKLRQGNSANPIMSVRLSEIGQKVVVKSSKLFNLSFLRFRSSNKTHKGKALPKFGDWESNGGPGGETEYTEIFNSARAEKKLRASGVYSSSDHGAVAISKEGSSARRQPFVSEHKHDKKRRSFILRILAAMRIC